MDHEKRVIPIVEREDFSGYLGKLTIHQGIEQMIYVKEGRGYYICSYRAINNMNAFTKSINMIVIHEGICYRKTTEEKICNVSICFATNCRGESFEIKNPELENFLMYKPEAVVSKEGVIILYTENEIWLTVDGHRYYQVLKTNIEEAIKKCIQNIKEITVGSQKVLVTLQPENSTETITKVMELEIDFLSQDIITGVNFI